MPLIQLTEDEAERLSKPVHGKGGLQELLRRLQGAQHGSTVTVRPRDLARIKRYYAYCAGGFESRLPINALMRAGLMPAWRAATEEELLALRAKQMKRRASRMTAKRPEP